VRDALDPARPWWRSVAGSCCAAALLVLGAGVETAHAGTAWLWACHGPSGQPLGMTAFAGSQALDGADGTYGVGCGAAAAVVGDGGLRATFTRPDPQAGSRAGWELTVPAGVTLSAVKVARLTDGFAGGAQPGDPQVYTAATSAGPLESTDLADASAVPLNGVLSADPASGDFVDVGIACELVGGPRCPPDTGGTVGVDFESIALRVADNAPPDGAVGNVRSPASGALVLELRASDAGLGLLSASASLDGGHTVTASLGGPTCVELSPSDATIDLALGADCAATVADVPLSLDTTALPDGPHQLLVTVTDAAGNTTTVVNQPIAVLNHPPVSSATANLEVGTGGPAAAVAGSNPVAGATGSNARRAACPVPKLSARLAERPLRLSKRRLPVLLYRHRYRYTGRLTCLVGGVRRNAPAETVVDVLNLVRHRTVLKSGTTVRGDGMFTILLAYPTDRTIVFAYRPSGAAAASVRLQVDVTPRPRPHK
jgi:hypothetical protein